VLDVCFRGESHVSQALVMALQEDTSEHQGPTEGHGRGNAEVGGQARGQAEAGGAAGTPLATEQPNSGTRPAPGAPAGTGAPAPSRSRRGRCCGGARGRCGEEGHCSRDADAVL
jgi:hypothetical protein